MKYIEVNEHTEWPTSPPYPRGLWLFNGLLYVVGTTGQWYTIIDGGMSFLRDGAPRNNGNIDGGMSFLRDGAPRNNGNNGGAVDVHWLLDQLLELKK